MSTGRGAQRLRLGATHAPAMGRPIAAEAEEEEEQQPPPPPSSSKAKKGKSRKAPEAEAPQGSSRPKRAKK